MSRYHFALTFRADDDQAACELADALRATLDEHDAGIEGARFDPVEQVPFRRVVATAAADELEDELVGGGFR